MRRRISVHFERADQLLKRLKASRLDASHDAEMRKLIRVDLLILDDYALTAMDPVDTAEVYELEVERHRKAPTVITSNRDPVEWLAVMADQLLAQSAIDRLTSAAYELVIDGATGGTRSRAQAGHAATATAGPSGQVRTHDATPPVLPGLRHANTTRQALV